MSHNLEIQTKYDSLVKSLRSSLTPELQDRYDDDILLRALLAKNKDLIAAQQLLERHKTARKHYPILFGSAHDPGMQDIIHTCVSYNPLFLTPNGHHLFFMKATDWNPDKHSVDLLFQSIIIGAEYKSLDYAVQEKGFVLLIDARDLGWKHVWSVRPKLVHALAQLIVYYLPIHVQNIIVYNTNWAVDMVWRIVRPLIPDEIVQKVVLCGSDEEKLSFIISKEAVVSQSFIPTDEMRAEYARDILAHDHVIQSLRNRYMI
jgi:hypothetical protein